MHTVTTLSTLADNYTYLVESEGEAVAIDPGEASPVLRTLQRSGSRLAAVLCTHGHFDHIGGGAELARTGCKVLSPEDVAFGNHAAIAFGALRFTVLSTPGHTADSVCFYLPAADGKSGDVFTGDTLFVGGCGRVLTKSPATMWTSLQLLATLPPDTRVFCGHDYSLENYEFAATVEPNNAAVRAQLEQIRALAEACEPTVPSTIGLEIATNPFLRAVTAEMKRALGMNSATDVEIFARLRRMKDDF